MPITSRSPSYLTRNAYSYYFRMNVPCDLRLYVGKRELQYTLKTSYIGIAKHKARYLASQVHILFSYFSGRGVLINKNI